MELNSRLKQIDVENFIYYVYIFLIILSFYANKLEKDYLIFKNESSKKQYRIILIIIFSIAIIVYFYYFYVNYQSVKNEHNNQKVVFYNNLSLFASTLVLISGFILLYIAYKDENVDVELSFS